MALLSLRELVEHRAPELAARVPGFLKGPIYGLGDCWLRLGEFREFFGSRTEVKGPDLLDEAFERLDVSYALSLRDRQRIPREGKLVIVANHPFGGLDGLAILRAVMEVRPDVRVVANDLLCELPGLSESFLPLDVFSTCGKKESLARISEALDGDEAVLFFPAGEVARLTWRGVRERHWRTGALHFARKHSAPILPVYVQGRNSWSFLGASFFSQTLSMLMLPRELFNKRGRVIGLRLGDLVPASSLSSAGLRDRALAQVLRKHVVLLGRGKKGLFRTECCIAHPVDRKLLRAELSQADTLGSTADGKRIYLADGSMKSLLREVARLRELTFRSVGEGTGQRLDLDEYDRHYKHIVLWDEAEWEVAGAYRIGDCAETLRSMGKGGLYSASLFDFSPDLEALLPEALEMGRSFVQPRFWNSRALDSLWQGIGALLAARPQVRYLFGCVSISATYPEPARELIVGFFRTWHGAARPLAVSRNPYRISRAREEEISALFPGRDFRGEMRLLKANLKELGCAVPTLYRQYTELSEPGGVTFHDFGVDKAFANCVDGFILLDVEKITAEKRARYIEPALPAPATGGAAS